MVPGARDLRVNGAACAAEKRVCKLTKTKRPSPLTQPTSLEISLTEAIRLKTPVIEIPAERVRVLWGKGELRTCSRVKEDWAWAIACVVTMTATVR
jgi:hypothetical protein